MIKGYRVSDHLNRKSDKALHAKMGRLMRGAPSQMHYKLANIVYSILRSRGL
jgi:rRNA pseudouridine-1189 N-methylase Emg1 (Nep1/Mra1 family)